MKKVETLNDKDFYFKAKEIIRIGNKAIFKAKKENKAHGLLEYFTKNDKLYYILPNGEIQEKPQANK